MIWFGSPSLSLPREVEGKKCKGEGDTWESSGPDDMLETESLMWGTTGYSLLCNKTGGFEQPIYRKKYHLELKTHTFIELS